MLSLSPVSRVFLDALNRKKVEYLLVGEYAVQYYGAPRKTHDLDIWIGTDAANSEKLLDVFHSFGVASAELTSTLFQHPNRIIRIDIQPMRIEILDPIIGRKPVSIQSFQGSQPEPIEILTIQTGADFKAAYASRIVEGIDGIDVNIVDITHLRAIKGSTERLKDIQDLVYLK